MMSFSTDSDSIVQLRLITALAGPIDEIKGECGIGLFSMGHRSHTKKDGDKMKKDKVGIGRLEQKGTGPRPRTKN